MNKNENFIQYYCCTCVCFFCLQKPLLSSIVVRPCGKRVVHIKTCSKHAKTLLFELIKLDIIMGVHVYKLLKWSIG